MKVILKPTMNLRELILQNWGTSSIGALSILLGIFGNLTADDLQTYIDWFNSVMAQENKLMRVGLVLAGIAGLLAKDPRTPSSPSSSNTGEPQTPVVPVPGTGIQRAKASDARAATGSPVVVS